VMMTGHVVGRGAGARSCGRVVLMAEHVVGCSDGDRSCGRDWCC